MLPERIKASDLVAGHSRIYAWSRWFLGNTDAKDQRYDCTVLRVLLRDDGFITITTTAGTLQCLGDRVFDVCDEMTTMDSYMPQMARRSVGFRRSVD
jgi:hypothetical protein